VLFGGRESDEKGGVLHAGTVKALERVVELVRKEAESQHRKQAKRDPLAQPQLPPQLRSSSSSAAGLGREPLGRDPIKVSLAPTVSPPGQRPLQDLASFEASARQPQGFSGPLVHPPGMRPGNRALGGFGDFVDFRAQPPVRPGY